MECNFSRCFNSITVQLRHTTQLSDRYHSLFQFHNGTIKTLAVLTLPVLQLQFQFHNGTIKTLQNPVFIRTDIAFQFHNGTIKTGNICLIISSKMSFNSITVQLRHRLHIEHNIRYFGFNSITVQLRLEHNIRYFAVGE